MAMTHITIQEALHGKALTRMEKVTNRKYQSAFDSPEGAS